MLYYFCLAQIIAYLFFIPVIRLMVGDVSGDYYFFISFSFLALYILGGRISHFFLDRDIFNNQNIIAKRKWLFIIWGISYILISYHYRMYDRNFGTGEAGIIFSQIPLYLLAVFRSFEIILPLFLSLFLIRLTSFNRLLIEDRFFDGILLLSICFSGALYSRSQLVFLLFSSLVILQNNVEIARYRKLVYWVIFMGTLSVMFVTTTRLIAYTQEIDSSYFSHEFLARLDGLEVISQLIDASGVYWLGMNPASAFSSFIAAIPFLSEATYLKANGLTTIKSVILLQEFGSSKRDINSFIVLDLYYVGGVLLIIFAGFFLGFVARWIDRSIGRGQAPTYIYALQVSIAMNMIIMEREFFSILISIFRDWFLVYVAMLAFIKRSPLNKII